MRRVLLVLVLVLAAAAAAEAACQTRTIYIDGRPIVCTTCCLGTSCTTTCY
ncbi:MAG: hypothetical protein ABID40_00005 [Candidatus Bipolaricaulota bacterium]